jgi:GTP-binding protein YchF
MKVGIVGTAKSGKSTVFNALTGMRTATDAFEAAKAQPSVAVAEVMDPRIDTLVEIYRPRKVTRARIEFVDFCGPRQDAPGRKALFEEREIDLIRSADALAIVARNFHNPFIDSTFGGPDAARGVEDTITELALNDLVPVETRLERIGSQMRRGSPPQAMVTEREALMKLVPFLEAPHAHPGPSLTAEEEKSIRGMRLLSLKPMLVILNSDEASFGADHGLLEALGRRCRVVEFAGRFEMELSSLDAHEASAFMEDMGIGASAKDRLTVAAYDVLGLLSFFTVGEDEVRAWTIRGGATAQEAAGAIHSDLSRGFIRAECFGFEDLMRHGSERALREKGLVRLEGKGYVVKDGDILSIRFKV